MHLVSDIPPLRITETVHRLNAPALAAGDVGVEERAADEYDDPFRPSAVVDDVVEVFVLLLDVSEKAIGVWAELMSDPMAEVPEAQIHLGLAKAAQRGKVALAMFARWWWSNGASCSVCVDHRRMICRAAATSSMSFAHHPGCCGLRWTRVRPAWDASLMALRDELDERGQLVIRGRFACGPLTLTRIRDVAGQVAHLDVDDAGAFLDERQAERLAAALERCGERNECLEERTLVINPFLGAGPLTLTVFGEDGREVSRGVYLAELSIRGSRLYLDAGHAQGLADGLKRCRYGTDQPGNE